MKKAWALVLSLTLAVGAFAGCGAKAPSSSAPAAEPGAASASDPAKGLSGEVVYHSMWQETEPQADALKVGIAAFEKANPDVKVTVEWVGRGVKDLIIAAISAGDKIDVFDSDPMVFYQSDPSILMDLTDFYAGPAIDGGTEAENIMGGLVEWDKSLSEHYSDGKNYTVPYSPFTIGWFYNSDMFSDAGITADPKTWEELDAVCAKLKEKGYEPIVTDDAYFDLMYQYYVARLIGEQAILDINEKGGDAWNNEAFLKGFQAMEDFAKKGYFAASVKTNKYPAGQQQLARKDKVAMYYDASFILSENLETAGPDFPYGGFPMPAVTGGTGSIADNTIGGQSFCISSKTDNKDAAFELVRYFVGDECQKAFADANLVPNNNTVEWPSHYAPMKSIIDQTTTNINWGAGFTSKYWTSIGKALLVQVTLGEKTAQAAFDELVSKAQSYVPPAE